MTTTIDDATHALHVWPCSVHLSQYIATNTHVVEGKRVIEIGAGGTGLPGITAAKCGATCTFVFCNSCF
jgi:predicted nicotinamide N-methyase